MEISLLMETRSSTHHGVITPSHAGLILSQLPDGSTREPVAGQVRRSPNPLVNCVYHGRQIIRGVFPKGSFWLSR
jgi:hypothetical protein